MMLMMQNFASNPNRSCNRTTDAVIKIGLRYLFGAGLIAALCSATGFRFFCINRYTEYSTTFSVEVG